MSTDLAALLHAWLPGVYRDKDVSGELARFLEIMAGPLTDLERSIDQLYEDLFIEGCQAELIPLIGSLIGVEVDPTLPARAQRAQVLHAIDFYRAKGRGAPLERFAYDLTGWPITLVDFSATVARVPHVETLDPVLLLRDRPVGEDPPGSGRFYARTDLARQPLFDAVTGRPITCTALDGHEAEYAGVEGRFTLEESGEDLFVPSTGTPYTAVAADLTDFADPRTPGGAPLAPGARVVAVDPELGRFLITSPIPQAGNLRVTYSALEPASIRTQAFDIRAPSPMTRLGRADDRAPYTADVRTPRRVTDGIGRNHFDNHGFFFVPGRVVANRRPNTLPSAGDGTRFTFDDRPLALAETDGIALQLMDGLDGRPITRTGLAGREAAFAGMPRGFTIRVKRASITDPTFRPRLTIRAADLSDFAQPKHPDGSPLIPVPTDVPVDPQLGRFVLDLTAFKAAPQDVRVDYLLGPASVLADAVPFALDPAVPEAFAFASDGRRVALRDAFDGTPIETALRLGRSLADYHGTARGWRILRNGTDVSADLTAELRDLGDPAVPVAAGQIAIDPVRGRFKFPSGLLAPGDEIRATFASEDADAQAELSASLAQKLPRALPAGVVPVVIDGRRTSLDPANLT